MRRLTVSWSIVLPFREHAKPVDHRSQKKNPATKAGFLLSSANQKRSIVVMMTVLLNDHDLGIVLAPAIVMAARPPTMKSAIVMSVFLDNDRSILRVCACGWQCDRDRAQSS
jgi:hypothetical protein